MRTSSSLRLSEADCRLLSAIEQRAALPFSEIARITHSKEHVVRYRFHALRKRGVILNRVPFVDMYRLGYSVFKIYCDIAPDRQKLQQKLIEYLTGSPQVVWIAQVGGGYQFVFSVCIKRISEITLFLEQLTERVGPVFSQTELAVQLKFTAFGRKYLAPTHKNSISLRFGQNTEEPASIDRIDHAILAELCRSDLASEKRIAETLSIPFTTLRRRIRCLENQNIIAGYIYRYNLSMIGLNRFSMLISVKGLSNLISKRMHEFCAKHPRIVNLGECIGTWQFEITADVESPADTISIIREIGESFGSEVAQITTLPIFRSFKYISYPGL